MAIKKRKPRNSSLRFQSYLSSSDITKKKPERRLTTGLCKSKGGRNAYGRITVRRRGGGVAKKYRIIDFKRSERNVPGRVAEIEYDPNRSARIALLHYADGEKRYIIAPQGLGVGDKLMTSRGIGHLATRQHLPDPPPQKRYHHEGRHGSA